MPHPFGPGYALAKTKDGSVLLAMANAGVFLSHAPEARTTDDKATVPLAPTV